ncbi:MAG: hypothetical protein WBA74_16495 [Cyclobacteriaceae bacterium]
MFNCSSYDKIEKEKVVLSGKTVLLKKYYRGLNYEVASISINGKSEEPFGKSSFYSKSGRRFFYEISNDTLKVYDSDFNIPSEGFDLNVELIDLNRPQIDAIINDVLNNKESKYSVFPPSYKEILAERNTN